MAQNRIKLNGQEIFQPVKGISWNFEKTYSSDATRTQSGKGKFKSLFWVQSFEYEAKDIPLSEASKILKIVIDNEYFNLYCANPYSGKWETIECYVGQGSVDIGTLKSGKEKLSSLKFNMIPKDGK